jgi:hypothetical protein
VLAHAPLKGWRRQSMRRGIHQRNPLVLIAALILVALILVSLELLVRDGAITTVPEGRFVRYRNDDNGHVNYLMARLREKPPQGTVVYLLGGSATMESFLSEQSLGSDVSKAAGRDVRVISLAAHEQSFAESLVLAENLPDGKALLAIGLAPMRFTNSPQDDAGLVDGDPFLLLSPRVRAILQKEHVRMLPFDSVVPGLFKYAAGYVHERRRVRLAMFADIGYSDHYTINGPLQSRAQKLFMARRDVAQDSVRYAWYADYNFMVLEQLVRLARERGFGVVFFDQPLNGHVIGPTWNGVVPSYRRRALALAARLGVPYLDVAQRVRLQDRDFLDVYHLVVRGRLKWQPVFSRELGAALKAGAPGAPTP